MKDKVLCDYCNKEFSKYGLKNHIAITHLGLTRGNKGKKSWCRGLTKETDERINNLSIKISVSLKGKKRKPLSELHKEKVSKGMKKAHSEGRAWNIGKSRWNNEPSYPEKFFMNVIENEFDDKNYVREYSVGKYSIDFAWPDKKIAIEIDGAQHERFEEYKLRDQTKDQLLESLGWKVQRINWKTFSNDTINIISFLKDFVNHGIILELNVDFNKVKIDKKRILIEEKIKLIENSNINFGEYGWVGKVSKILNITPQKVNQWIKNNMFEFYQEKCFKRTLLREVYPLPDKQ